jgi:hypothetical protein
LAHDLAGHDPSSDIEAVGLERRERLGTTEPGIVGHARCRGQVRRTVSTEHDDADTEVCTPSEGVEGDGPRSVEDDEAPQSMGGSGEAAGTTVRAYVVVDFESTTLHDAPHAESVGDTDASQVGSGIGLGERRHGPGDILRREHQRRLRNSGASLKNLRRGRGLDNA